MRALITGASGFLGGRLAEMLHAQGEQVTILARAGSRLDHLSSLPLRIVRGDLNHTQAFGEAVQEATHIYHCAACSTDWAPQRTYLEANVTGTRNLLAAAQSAHRLERFLHVSTTDVYGYPERPCPESSPIVDAGLPYNQTTGQGEAAVWQAHRETGLPVTVVRPATIYGPRGKDFTVEIAKLLRQRLMAYIDRGGSPGGFTYVDNVAQAMIDASTNPGTAGEAYNISDGTGATWKQYVGSFAAQLGVPAPRISLPFGAAMKVAAGFETSHRLLRLPGRPLLTRHAVYLLARNQEFPNAKARSAFGFNPQVSLEEGTRRSVEWLQRGSVAKSQH